MSLEKSEALYQIAKEIIPGATQTLSKGADRFVNGVTPKYISHGEGSHVWDVDGNEYVDWPMALGAILLGYGRTHMEVGAAAQLGGSFTLPHPLEVKLAQKLIDIIPCAEMVRFCKNGSDATEGAVRIARAVTDRKHIAYCGYHGSHDWSAVTGGLKRGLIDDGYVHPFEYNNINSLHEVFAQWQCAAVIMEQGLEDPEIYPLKNNQNFLQVARNVAVNSGALFILDEIVTGFRYALGGAQQVYNVTPDLCTMGKAMGNGLPISVILGKKEYMKVLNEGVFFSFTFAGDTVAMASALATIEILEKENVIESLWQKGRFLRQGIINAAEAAGLKINLRGNAVRSVLEILDDDGKPDRIAYSVFLQETINFGILFGIPIFPCHAHSLEDITRTVNAVRHAFNVIAKIQRSGEKMEAYLNGEPIVPPVIRA